MVSTVISTPTDRLADRLFAFMPSTVETCWRRLLPVLDAGSVTLRELRTSDAPSLLQHLSTEEVSRFISPPPTAVDGYERFIEWTHDQRAAGHGVCFGIVPAGCEHAVGLIQVRDLGSRFDIAEWGFALGSQFWGTGVFAASAASILAFAFDVLEVRRLEARACVANERGNGALKKLGATVEARLRASFLKNGVRQDQYLWTILAETWRAARVRRLRIH